MNRYDQATTFADRIEGELRRIGAWQAESLPDTAYDSEQAFLSDTMSFYQWIQFVLLPRVRSIIEECSEFPRESSAGAYAIRELDGNYDAAALVTALCEFDAFVEGLHRPRKKQGPNL